MPVVCGHCMTRSMHGLHSSCAGTCWSPAWSWRVLRSLLLGCMQDIRSGNCAVHNTWMLDHPQKSVLWAPWRYYPCGPCLRLYTTAIPHLSCMCHILVMQFHACATF